MAYTPLSLICVSNRGQRKAVRTASVPNSWLYRTTDAQATWNTAGYITDAKLKNMKVGDYVHVLVFTGAALTGAFHSHVMAITDGAGDLSDGVSIAVTNSD